MADLRGDPGVSSSPGSFPQGGRSLTLARSCRSRQTSIPERSSIRSTDDWPGSTRHRTKDPGPPQHLAAVAESPAVRAADLAASLQVERDVFKRNVRKLKELGLTLSLERGYRLSPRGEAYVAAKQQVPPAEDRLRPSSRLAEPVIERARWAERVGFDGVVAAETSHDPFLALAVSTMEAPSLDLETAIAVAFPRSPTITAHIAWDLAEASGGRFTLGVGEPGSSPHHPSFWRAMGAPGAADEGVHPGGQGGVGRMAGGGTPPLRRRLLPALPDDAVLQPGADRSPGIPVVIAAVNPAMCRLAGELCQGLVVHPFHTVDYLDQVVKPAVAAGAERTGRSAERISLHAAVMVVTGRDESRDGGGSRPSTSPDRLLCLHSLLSAGRGARGMGRRAVPLQPRQAGTLEEMGDLIDEEMLDQVAVVAPLEEVGEAIRRRYEESTRPAQLLRAGRTGSATGDDSWARLISETRG